VSLTEVIYMNVFDILRTVENALVVLRAKLERTE